VTRARNFKRRVRARMAERGETYQQALAALYDPDKDVRRQRAAGKMTDAEVFAEYGPHLGIPLPPET
jgi:hypothetical protein